MQLTSQADRRFPAAGDNAWDIALVPALVACTALHLQLSGQAYAACALLQVMLRLAESPAFVAAMAAQQDYEASVLQKAHKILTEKSLGEYAHAARLQALIEQVRSLCVSSVGILGPCMAPPLLQTKCTVEAGGAGSVDILMACLDLLSLRCCCRPGGCSRQGQDRS